MAGAGSGNAGARISKDDAVLRIQSAQRQKGAKGEIAQLRASKEAATQGNSPSIPAEKADQTSSSALEKQLASNPLTTEVAPTVIPVASLASAQGNAASSSSGQRRSGDTDSEGPTRDVAGAGGQPHEALAFAPPQRQRSPANSLAPSLAGTGMSGTGRQRSAPQTRVDANAAPSLVQSRADAAVHAELLQQANAKVDRYRSILLQGLHMITEIKTAMYNADSTNSDGSADYLFEDTRSVLFDEFLPLLGVASELQKAAEQQVQLRRELDAWSKVTAQVEKERKHNASLSRQAERAETEFEELRQAELMKAQQNARPKRSKKQTYKEEGVPESELGLDAMKGVVQAFTDVLMPQLPKLKDVPPSQATPAEHAVLRWLDDACGNTRATTKSVAPGTSGDMTAHRSTGKSGVGNAKAVAVTPAAKLAGAKTKAKALVARQGTITNGSSKGLGFGKVVPQPKAPPGDRTVATS